MQDKESLIDAATGFLRAHIEGHGLPPGAAIEVASVCMRYAITHEIASAALRRLQSEGLIETDDEGSFRIPTGLPQRLRDLMARIEPVLVAMAQVAATQATAADVAAMAAARNAMDAAIAVMDGPARAQAYRAFITAWAAATGNAFYVSAAAILLRESGDLVDILTRIDLGIYTENSEDGELRRLVDAVSAGNAILAAQAAGDHVMIMSHRLGGLAENPGSLSYKAADRAAGKAPVNECGSIAASPDPALQVSRETSVRPSTFSSSG